MTVIKKNLPTPTRAALPALPPCPQTKDILKADKTSLPALRQQIARACKPISAERAEKAITVMLAQIPKASEAMLANPELFVQGMVEEASRYPEAVVNKSIRELRRTCIFTPAIAELVKRCEENMRARRNAKRALRIREDGIRGACGEAGSDYFFVLEHLDRPGPEGGAQVMNLLREQTK